MAQGAKVKAKLTEAKTLKLTGASGAEASTAAGLCKGIAESGEAGPELQAVVVALGRELEAPPTQTDPARREVLMIRLQSLVAGSS